MNYRIALIPGDGIGLEVVPEGVRVLQEIAGRHNFSMKFTEFPYSCDYYSRHGVMMPADGLDRLRTWIEDTDTIEHDLPIVTVVGLDLPLLLWGLPEPANHGRLRLNSLTGLNSAGYVLGRLGRKYAFVYGPPEQRAAAEIRPWLSAALLVRELLGGVVDAADLLLDDPFLDAHRFFGNRRPADEVREDVDELLEVLLEHLRVVARRLFPRERVVLAADRLEIVRDPEGVPALRSAENDVLEEMREAALPLPLATRAAPDPHGERDRRGEWVALIQKRRSRREDRFLRTWQGAHDGHARAEPCGSA